MTNTRNDAEPFVLFELAGTTYGVRSRFVQQMEMIEHVTPVPNAPAAVEGVVLARGQVVPVLNLRMRFGFEKIAYDLRSRLVVVNSGGRTIGLIVDTAREFLRIPESTIEPPPEAITGLSGKYLEGIATINGRMILVLDLDEVIDIGEEQEAIG
ncbi:MAG: purine-binding chemotaxis protein CheW [Acidobacteriota bacterium]|jgi:purine-binding chemotaxis protein CheW|nr:purine-binding chemotaxis protein CheW [Acidobacteriota bacterium]MDT7807772.1 purine-binding chemotaxis protein CheW [Acidobacteriota bacterium]